MLPIECVVRGYLSGSGWKDYRATGTVCGHLLPEGLVESARLPEPIFTPATKATSGHDENITREQAAELVGAELYRGGRAALARAVPLRLGARARARDHHRRHEVRVRRRRRGRAHARRRGAHPRLVPLLAGRRVRARRRAAVVRQAVRARLLRDARLGQDRPGARDPGRPRRRDARPLRRGVRAADRDRVRRLPRRPDGGARDEGHRARAPEGGDPRPAGPGGRGGAAPPRLPHRRMRASAASSTSRWRRPTRPTPAPRSSGCARSCSRTR